MSTWRVTAIVTGCGLAAVWVAAVAGAWVYAREPVAMTMPTAVAREGVSAGELLPLSLDSPLPAPPRLSPHRRNLFQVRERPLGSALTTARVSVMSAAAEPIDTSPVLPMLALAGIAESQQGGRAVRTAVISGAGELWIVTERMVVAGRYRVDRIDREAVVMADTASGQIRTLRLR